MLWCPGDVPLLRSAPVTGIASSLSLSKSGLSASVMNRQEARLVLRYVLRWPEDPPQQIAVREDRACREEQWGVWGDFRTPRLLVGRSDFLGLNNRDIFASGNWTKGLGPPRQSVSVSVVTDGDLFDADAFQTSYEAIVVTDCLPEVRSRFNLQCRLQLREA